MTIIKRNGSISFWPKLLLILRHHVKPCLKNGISLSKYDSKKIYGFAMSMSGKIMLRLVGLGGLFIKESEIPC